MGLNAHFLHCRLFFKLGTHWWRWLERTIRMWWNLVIHYMNTSWSFCQKAFIPSNTRGPELWRSSNSPPHVFVHRRSCTYRVLCLQTDTREWKVNKQMCDGLWLCVGVSDCESVCVFVWRKEGGTKRKKERNSGRDGESNGHLKSP